ncbi:phosphate system positive regulatory protein pho81, partial [Ascosphaera atra]
TLLLLRDSGADLDQRDKVYSWTPLFHAAAEGRVECLRTLLGCGVDVDVVDEKGLSAMYYAAWEGRLECMILLWEQRRRRESIVASAATPAAAREVAEKNAIAQTLSQIAPPAAEIPSGAVSEAGEMDIDDLPDLSLPPPIIPMRRYGHNFLETKAFVQLYFDQPVNAGLTSASTPQLPATDNAAAAANSASPRSPPHAPVTGPITFYQPGRYAAARLTMSSKNSDLIPRTIMLPMHNSSSAWDSAAAADTERIVTFQVDLDRPDPFALELEVFSTFGSKPIAKTVALPEVFVGQGTSVDDGGEQRSIGKSGTCVLPLLDPRLRAIGEVKFRFMVIQPYQGEPLEITHFATYWKATTTGTGVDADHHPHHPSTAHGLPPANGIPTSNAAAAATMPPAAAAGPVTGSSLSGDYVQLFVQLTRDRVPVVFPYFNVRYFGLEIPVAYLSYEQFRDAVPAGLRQQGDGNGMGDEVPALDVGERLALLENF